MVKFGEMPFRATSTRSIAVLGFLLSVAAFYPIRGRSPDLATSTNGVQTARLPSEIHGGDIDTLIRLGRPVSILKKP
jgi:hypothetical protein